MKTPKANLIPICHWLPISDICAWPGWSFVGNLIHQRGLPLHRRGTTALLPHADFPRTYPLVSSRHLQNTRAPGRVIMNLLSLTRRSPLRWRMAYLPECVILRLHTHSTRQIALECRLFGTATKDNRCSRGMLRVRSYQSAAGFAVRHGRHPLCVVQGTENSLVATLHNYCRDFSE